MMSRVKYVRTKDDEIIIFGEIMQHSDFIDFSPVSAGFISFGISKNGNPTCRCYGNSISLNMESNVEEDTRLAKFQLGLLDW
jgi:hypothetical protein